MGSTIIPQQAGARVASAGDVRDEMDGRRRGTAGDGKKGEARIVTFLIRLSSSLVVFWSGLRLF
jgi:hypothetical protein